MSKKVKFKVSTIYINNKTKKSTAKKFKPLKDIFIRVVPDIRYPAGYPVAVYAKL